MFKGAEYSFSNTKGNFHASIPCFGLVVLLDHASAFRLTFYTYTMMLEAAGSSGTDFRFRLDVGNRKSKLVFYSPSPM